jgi:glycosyltransferase involved in cell wall biosynthesis
MVQAMVRRDGAALDALADGMGELSGEGAAGLPHLRAFIDARRAAGTFDEWLDRAARHRVDEHVTWLGLVDHGVLAHLWPLAETSVVPSVLAEAFGMVAAEAAACGCVPIVADHSGLADAASVIELGGVTPIRFDPSDEARAIDELARVLIQRLDLDPAGRDRQAMSARSNVAAAWSWDELAGQVAELMCSPRA